MSTTSKVFARQGDGVQAQPAVASELIELWSSLSRRAWTSLLLVPADPDGSTAEMAKILADVGRLLSFDPVTAVTTSSLEFGSALALVDLQRHARGAAPLAAGSPRAPLIEVTSPPPSPEPPAAASWPQPSPAWASPASPPPAHEAQPTQHPPPQPSRASDEPQHAPPAQHAPSENQAIALASTSRLILSIPPVIVEPLGIPAAHEADMVVLAIRRARTRLANVRRTIELVGRERVLGCYFVA